MVFTRSGLDATPIKPQSPSADDDEADPGRGRPKERKAVRKLPKSKVCSSIKGGQASSSKVRRNISPKITPMKKVPKEIGIVAKNMKASCNDDPFKHRFSVHRIRDVSCFFIRSVSLAIAYMDHLEIPVHQAIHKINYSVPRICHVSNKDFEFIRKIDTSRLQLNPPPFGALPFRNSSPYPNPVPLSGYFPNPPAMHQEGAEEESGGAHTAPKCAEQEEPVIPSLDDWLHGAGPSRHQAADAPAADIEAFFDSLGPSKLSHFLKPAQNLIHNFAKTTLNYGFLKTDVSGFQSVYPSTPTQSSTCDCGFYVMDFMDSWNGKEIVGSALENGSVLAYRKQSAAMLLRSEHNKVDLKNFEEMYMSPPNKT